MNPSELRPGLCGLHANRTLGIAENFLKTKKPRPFTGRAGLVEIRWQPRRRAPMGEEAPRSRSGAQRAGRYAIDRRYERATSCYELLRLELKNVSTLKYLPNYKTPITVPLLVILL